MLPLEIIGTESLGVRGLCCLFTTADRRFLIDPGISLGYLRYGLLPHPLQIAAGRRVHARIVDELTRATDVVVSHLHGDHLPLAEANPYQLAIADLPELPSPQRWWSASGTGASIGMHRRLEDLQRLLGSRLRIAEGFSEGPLRFSEPVPHGVSGSQAGSVMMTRIESGAEVFVHASDIQLLDRDVIDEILAWRPTIVLAAGPPLHMPALGERERRVAFENAVRLARGVETLIVDHHLMRSTEGERWLDQVSAEAGRRVCCAADYLARPRLLLEARRQQLYEDMPVPPDWHERYVLGDESVEAYEHDTGSGGSDGRGRPIASC